MNTIAEQIAELKKIQAQEEANNFENGDLWNECEDQVFNLKKYGQSNNPHILLDKDGYEIGYLLNNGTEVTYQGMSFENQY